MKLSQTLLTVVLAGVVAFGVTKFAAAPTAQSEVKKESAFERVMRTNTLRCGYIIIPPEMTRDPNTGALSGVSYDIVMEAAKRLSLKVDWAEEATFVTMTEGLKTGRYDSLCFTLYRWAPSARAVEYSVPLFWSTTNAYVREDDNRFDSSLKAINTPNVTVATTDGEASTFIHSEDFPLSKTTSLPQNSDLGLMLDAVSSRKADATFLNALAAMPYLETHPKQLKRIDGDKPLRINSHALAFAKGEHNLTTMFDVVLEEMLADGVIDKILDKYEAIPNSFVRVKNHGNGK